MAWNVGPSDGSSWNDGPSASSFENDATNDLGLPETGEFLANDGGCFNCGEQGHVKSDCPNPRQTNNFTGTCHSCGEEGHRMTDCPTAPPKVCKNCLEPGHEAFTCEKSRALNRSNIADLMPEDGWKALVRACKDEDLDDIRAAVKQYVKAVPSTTYQELEKAFRHQNLSVYVIALEREVSATYTIMDMQGNLEKKYIVSFRLSDKPRRPREKEGWPASSEENFERLSDAGEAVDRGVPKCSNCEQLGHIAKNCPEERQEILDRAIVKCYNCDTVGHRIRDCPLERPDRFSCRNCKQPGHSSKECPEPRSAENVQCKKCEQTGHFARDCPLGGGGGESGCRNCGQEGHIAKECPEPLNMAKMTCRNCDEVGHMGKECPKPRDYSRVKCSNCQRMGHTKVRCKEPLVGEEDNSNNFDNNNLADDAFGGNAESGASAVDNNDAWDPAQPASGW